MKDNNDPNDMPLISSYRRAQAIADGVLLDLTEWARETGFKLSLACTAAVRHGYIVPADELRPVGQSERGRAHDILWLLHVAIGKCPPCTDRLTFKVTFLMSPRNHETIELKASCGPGDAGEPVLTILLSHED